MWTSDPMMKLNPRNGTTQTLSTIQIPAHTVPPLLNPRANNATETPATTQATSQRSRRMVRAKRAGGLPYEVEALPGGVGVVDAVVPQHPSFVDMPRRDHGETSNGAVQAPTREQRAVGGVMADDEQ
jgi:hypothetical protein